MSKISTYPTLAYTHRLYTPLVVDRRFERKEPRMLEFTEPPVRGMIDGYLACNQYWPIETYMNVERTESLCAESMPANVSRMNEHSCAAIASRSWSGTIRMET